MQMNRTILAAPKEDRDPHHTLAARIAAVSIVFAIFNIVALLVWSYLVLFMLAYHGPIRMAPAFILYLFPYIYLLMSLYSCFGKNPELRKVKYLLNVPLIILFIIVFTAKLPSWDLL